MLVLLSFFTFSLLICDGFFLKSAYSSRSSLNGTGSDSSKITQNTIIGLFDAVTGLTHGIGDVMEQFDHNLDSTTATEDDDETIVDRIDVKKKVQTEIEGIYCLLCKCIGE